MAKGTPAKTEQVTKVELPAWVNEASESNYNLAQKIANTPLQQYGGATVAGQSGMTTDAYKLINNNVGAQDPLYEAAYGLQGRAATENDPIFTTAQGILADTAKPWDPTPYLNPWINNVEDRAISNAERALTGQVNQVTDAASKAGAFGGSRHGVTEGVTRAEGVRGIGDLSAELRKAGYDKATADLVSDRTGRQNAANSMITGANTQNRGWLDAATGILGTAKGRQDSVMTDANALLGAGASEEAFSQKNIDANMKKFYEARDHPTEMLNLLLASLGMSPYGKTESSTKTGTSESQGTDWATVGLGALKTLPALVGMFSDRRAKTDIKKLGKDPKTGLPLYAYRYKGDPKSYPKVVGPMAQDVEKMYPGAVDEINGHKVIKGLLAA
jgi:hypothetical protein